MKCFSKALMASAILFTLTAAHAELCPDPAATSLVWGEIPPPWQQNPYSVKPQGEEGTTFVHANLLVIGGIGRGVTCTYRNSLGDFTIWQEVPVKLPNRTETSWYKDRNNNYECSDSIPACIFYPGKL